MEMTMKAAAAEGRVGHTWDVRRERGPFITHHVHMEQPSDIHNKAPPKSELRVSGPAPTKSEDVRGQCGGAVWQIKACESSTNATYWVQDAASVGGTKHFPNPAFFPSSSLSSLSNRFATSYLCPQSSFTVPRSRAIPRPSDTVRRPQFRNPCCIGPKQEDHFMGFQWQIPPSVRFQISEITEIRRFNCNCRPPIRFPPFSRAVRDKIDLPRSTRPLILPIPFPHSLRRAIFVRIMEE